jgi:hypothetical protein
MRKLKTKKSVLIKKPKQIIGSGRSFDEQRMGTEPVFDDNSTESDIMHGLNWYSHFHEADQSKKWMLEYMKHSGYSKEDIQKVKSFSWGKAGVLVDGPKTVYLKGGGFLARMFMRGFENLPREYIEKINFYIDYSKKKGELVVEQKFVEKKINEHGHKPSIQNYIKEQVSLYASEIEQSIDGFFDNDYEPTINVYDWLVSKEVKGLIAKKIANEFHPHLTEIKSIPTDEDLAESYDHMTKKQLVKYENFIQTIISDCERYSANVNKQRKPRKKKPISVSKQIAKLNYKKQDDEYKIASINPSEIVGADRLYVFNSKYRKLGVYQAEGHAGLSVKGSTLRGFDLSLSKCKKVRKPEEVLTKMLSGGKLAIKKQYESINSKEKDLTGRINNETILLKIVK